MAIEVELTPEERQRCLNHAYARQTATAKSFSYATQEARGGTLAYQYEVEVIGAMAECAFAVYLDPDRPDHSVWDYVGRKPGSTDFVVNGKTVEVKATYTPPSRNPHLAILPNGKRSDLYVLAYTHQHTDRVWFLGWAYHDDFPAFPRVLPGWRSATLNLGTNRLRRFEDFWGEVMPLPLGEQFPEPDFKEDFSEAD